MHFFNKYRCVKFTDKEDERFVCTSSLDICLQDNLERKLIRKEC